MTAKYLIFGATGSIGSNLADQLYNSNEDIHLIARNEQEVKSLSDKFKWAYSVADVLQDGFIEKVKNDIKSKSIRASLKKRQKSRITAPRYFSI